MPLKKHLALYTKILLAWRNGSYTLFYLQVYQPEIWESSLGLMETN